MEPIKYKGTHVFQKGRQCLCSIKNIVKHISLFILSFLSFFSQATVLTTFEKMTTSILKGPFQDMTLHLILIDPITEMSSYS